MTKIAIFGANGMLGEVLGNLLSGGTDRESEFKEPEFKVTALTRADFDIGGEPFEHAVSLIKDAQIIINCAGILASQFAKHTPEQIFAVNSLFPQNLARFCACNQKQLILISSDGVFATERGDYLETDYPNARDLYGLSKALGESSEAMTLRVSIIGEEEQNQRSLIAWMKQKQGGEITGFTNQLWNGVTTLTLANAIKQIISQKLYQTGIFHLHSPSAISKHDLLVEINRQFKLNISIKKGEGPPSNRTLASHHNLSKELIPWDISEQLTTLVNTTPRPQSLDS